MPNTRCKSFPDYIPAKILKDYRAACLIKNASPNASATIARRCLQGMIRDFHAEIVQGNTLKQEIDSIQNAVSMEIWHAIDAVRKMGNIGAHMEKDTNLIVDVDSDEAERLIGLIEFLFAEWYIRRHDTQQRLQELTAMAANKKT